MKGGALVVLLACASGCISTPWSTPDWRGPDIDPDDSLVFARSRQDAARQTRNLGLGTMIAGAAVSLTGLMITMLPCPQEYPDSRECHSDLRRTGLTVSAIGLGIGAIGIPVLAYNQWSKNAWDRAGRGIAGH